MTENGKDRRRYPRIERRAKVQFKVEGRLRDGLIVNFSEFGLCLKTADVFPPGTPITIPLNLGPDSIVSLEGKVAWTQEPSREGAHTQMGSMGIELFAPPGEYLSFIANMGNQLSEKERSADTRYEVFHVVRYQTGEAFLSEYTENLSRGGMYLRSEKPLDPGTPIRALLEIPGVETPIEIDGRVAYRLDETEANSKGRVAGMGIQFVDLSDEARGRLDQYLRRLAIHRTKPERRHTEELPEKGDLSDFLVPEIILSLREQKTSGTLILSRRGVTKLIYIKNGEPIYVDSNVRSETLSQYMIREGMLSSTQVEDLMDEYEKRDLFFGELLVIKELIDGPSLAGVLIDHQGEKLLNTFPWFEGTFEFVPGEDWPSTIQIFPLQAYQIVFQGVLRWYDAPLIGAWMGLSEKSAILRVKTPPEDASVPPMVLRVLNRASTPQTIEKLSERLQVAVDELLPAAFALIIAGWAVLDFSGAIDLSTPEFKSETQVSPPSQELLGIVQRWITEDFNRLSGLHFHELLGVDQEAGEEEVTRAYLERAGRYSAYDVAQIDDTEVRKKVVQILSWLRLAYDTLRDPNLRQIYISRSKTEEQEKERRKTVEAERVIISAVQELEQGKVDDAVTKLTRAMEQRPEDPVLPGYLAWALFRKDPKLHMRQSSQLLDEALGRDPAESQLWYYRGEIAAYLGNLQLAEKYFSRALRIHPKFVKAKVALDLTKEKLSAAESQPTNA